MHNAEYTQVTSLAADAPTDEAVIDALVGEGAQNYAVVVTKEIPVTAGLIARFPASVRLLVEAGTGYNNIDLQVKAWCV